MAAGLILYRLELEVNFVTSAALVKQIEPVKGKDADAPAVMAVTVSRP